MTMQPGPSEFDTSDDRDRGGDVMMVGHDGNAASVPVDRLARHALKPILDRALADVRENIGPQSQAAFAIEAIIRACEG